jgi:hypothetical protein
MCDHASLARQAAGSSCYASWAGFPLRNPGAQAEACATHVKTIAESDWKIFRQLAEVALQRFCERILAEVSAIASDPKKTSHERYLGVWRILKRRDRELALAFNDLRRSAAFEQLAVMQAHQLLTEEEMARFSAETRQVVDLFRSL